MPSAGHNKGGSAISTQSPDAEKRAGAGASRLIREARDRGEADGYSGKREWARWRAETPLEISTDPSDGSACWPVAMHNVSEGGISVWSKRQADLYRSIYIRALGDDESGRWIAARVTHCTCGIRGFLIGAEFADPASEGGDDL